MHELYPYKMPRKKGKTPPSWITPYTLYYIHSTPRESRLWGQNYIQICGIDPGEKNLGIRIERRSYVSNGTATHVQIAPILFSRFDISGANMSATLINCISLLQQIQSMLIECHVFVIERQLFTKNPDASRIFQHILTWLMCYCGNSALCPDIYEVDPKWIKQMMSLIVGKGKGNKTIMPYRIRALYFAYGDINSWSILSAVGKKDDLADAGAMCEAICRAHNLPYIMDMGTFVVWDSLEHIKTYTQLGVQ